MSNPITNTILPRTGTARFLGLILLLLIALIATTPLARANHPFVEIVKTGPDSANPGDLIEFTLTVRTYGHGEITQAIIWDDLLYASLDRYEIFRTELTTEQLEALNVGDPVVIIVPFQVPCDAGGHVLDNDAYVEARFKQPVPGAGTPGYWMNHPEAWPVDKITIGGLTYTRDDAIEIMKQSVSGDKTYTMFPALVASRLNVLIGNDDSCIAGTIAAADAWMALYGPVRGGVAANSEAWKAGEPLYETLDAYNNGLLCAPSRDNLDETITRFATNDHDVTVPRPAQVDCTPAIDLEKWVNGQDADAPAEAVQVAAGSALRFEYLVTNTGDAALFNIKVTDDHETPGDTYDDVLVGSIFSLGPGQSGSFTLDSVAQAGLHTNLGVACGTSSGGSGSQFLCDSDPASYQAQ